MSHGGWPILFSGCCPHCHKIIGSQNYFKKKKNLYRNLLCFTLENTYPHRPPLIFELTLLGHQPWGYALQIRGGPQEGQAFPHYITPSVPALSVDKSCSNLWLRNRKWQPLESEKQYIIWSLQLTSHMICWCKISLWFFPILPHTLSTTMCDHQHQILSSKWS